MSEPHVHICQRGAPQAVGAEWTRILRPGEKYTECWAMPSISRPSISSMILQIDREWVTFYLDSEQGPAF
jgi:hypothetical protein